MGLERYLIGLSPNQNTLPSPIFIGATIQRLSKVLCPHKPDFKTTAPIPLI